MSVAHKKVKEIQTPNEKGNDSNIPNQSTQLSVFANRHFNIKDLICPFKIDLSELNNTKLISNIPRFVRSFFVSTMPRFLHFGEFLRPLYNFGNSNTSVYIYPINQGLAQSNLNSIINQFEQERLDAIKQGNSNKERILQQKKIEAESLRDEISTNFNKLFEVTILSSVFGNSPEGLNALSDILGIEMAKNLVNIKSAWSQQEDVIKSNIPHNHNIFQRNNTFDTFGLATAFPFISTDISHPTGIPIGINKKTNFPIIVDTFHPSLPNHNVLILGKNASGKRIALQLFSMRSYVLSGIKSISIDSDGRHCKIAQSLDGLNVPITPTSKIIINPFDLETEIKNDEITGREIIILNLKEKIEDVTNILMTMARGPIRSSYVSEITREIIKSTVTEEYNSAEISNNSESLYSSHGANLIGTKITRHKKPVPTIGSWYKRLCEKARSNLNVEYKYHYEYLIKYMKDYVRELGGTIPLFDGQTNLDLSADISFINFDLSKLDSKFSKPLATHILMSWIRENYIKTNNEDKAKAEEKRFIIDEAWLLLPYPEASEFIKTIAQHSTKKNVSIAIISQRFEDFYNNKDLCSLLSCFSTKLFMKQDESEIEYIKEVFKLTNGERDFIESCPKGEGILQIGTSSAQIYIAPTEHEIDMMDSETSGNFMLMSSDSD